MNWNTHKLLHFCTTFCARYSVG